MVELQKNQSLGDSFRLLISLAEIHVPRMWVERMAGNDDSQVKIFVFALFHVEFQVILHMWVSM